MPELPEVETIVNELKPVITGKTLQKIDVFWRRSVVGDPEVFINESVNRTIEKVFRRGKYICFLFDDGRRLTIHLRMTGKLLYATSEKEKKHLRVRFTFCEDCKLYFIDTRKFGRMKLLQAGQPLLPELGPEPLDAETVYGVLTGTKSIRAIKTLILDQHILAGVGNIYADEALFAAGIHPQTPAAKAAKNKIRRLSRELPEILRTAIRNKGTTLSDYRPPESSSGSNQFYLKVYGRKDQPCPKCGAPIQRIVINARASHFCPGCQKK
jgi:formamidopyrimidine-DNA glycosylase